MATTTPLLGSDHVRDIQRHIIEHRERYFGPDYAAARVEIERAFARTTPMLVFGLRSPAGRAGVFVKIGRPFHSNDPARTLYNIDTETEYRHLRRMHPLGDEACGTARPLDYLPDHYALLLEEVRGTPGIDYAIRHARPWAPGRAAGLHEVVTRAATWLRRFHEAGEIIHCPFTPPYARCIGLCLQNIRGFERDVFEREYAIIDESTSEDLSAMVPRLAADVDSGRAGMLARHGDFGFGNMIIDEGARMVILDMGIRAACHPEGDLANFCTHLELMPYLHLVSAPLCRALREVFLDRYRSEGGHVEIRLLRTYTLVATLGFAVRHCGRASGLPRPVRATVLSWLGRHYSARIRRILAELRGRGVAGTTCCPGRGATGGCACKRIESTG